jgi:hypothetical protein
MQPNQMQPNQMQNPGMSTGQPQQIMGQQPIKPQPTPKNPNSTQNSLLVSEIRDGIAIMIDGSFRSVVLAKSINFDLMSEQEREAVEYAYQGFLNSLYFDIQIIVKSRKIDMRPYIQKLQQTHDNLDNMLLAMLMEDYIYFIDDLVTQSNIMSKQFYIVVPYYPDMSGKDVLKSGKKLLGGLFEKNTPVVTINQADLEKAKTELKNRVGAVLEGLQNLGVQAMPLDTQELIELYYNTYNPDTAPRQTLNDAAISPVPVVTKGQGTAGAPYTTTQQGGV